MNSFHARQKKPRADTPATTLNPPRESESPAASRLDSLLVARKLAPSRTAAQRMISAGRVSVDGRCQQKASLAVAADARLDILPDDADRYVSRGGLKLAGALGRLGWPVHGLVALDVGQSTGGFTDCLLQAGATRVLGVEVGHGQLHSRLAADPRVHCLEGLNARHLTSADLGAAMPAGGFELLVCDTSFISLTLLLPQWPALLAPGGRVISLVKPQFEVGREGLAKGGIVRDTRLYPEVEAIIRAAAKAASLVVDDYFESPITGGDGNREFFLAAHRPLSPGNT